MKNNTNIVLAIIAIIALIGLVLVSNKDRILQSGFVGMPSHLQVATTTATGPDLVVTLFSDTENCKSRTISTVASALMLTFGDPVNGDLASTTLNGTAGHLQPASTTVSYPSDEFGCGRVSAYGFSSTTITISSF